MKNYMSIFFAEAELGQKETGRPPQPDPFQTKISTVSLAVWLREGGDSAGSVRWGCLVPAPLADIRSSATGSSLAHPFFVAWDDVINPQQQNCRLEKPQPQRGQQTGRTLVFLLDIVTLLSYIIIILSEIYPSIVLEP